MTHKSTLLFFLLTFIQFIAGLIEIKQLIYELAINSPYSNSSLMLHQVHSQAAYQIAKPAANQTFTYSALIAHHAYQDTVYLATTLTSIFFINPIVHRKGQKPTLLYECQDCSNCYSCNQCLDESNMSIIIIVVSISFPLTCLILLCCARRKKKLNAQPIQVANIPQAISSAINLAPNLRPINSAWKRSIYKFNSQQKCGICIQDNSLLQTSCNHYFHPKCIIEWARRKQSCQLCNSSNLATFKLYCKECSKSFLQVNLTILRGLTLVGKWENCPACLNAYL